MDTKEAVKMALDKELDLIEVSPNSRPPVAKIMSWSKFKYEQEKKRKESKRKSIEQKEMWFKVFIDKGDLEHKLKVVREFLSKKHPVKLTIKSKGRINKEQMTNLMTNILNELSDIIKYDDIPRFEGKNYIVVVRSNK